MARRSARRRSNEESEDELEEVIDDEFGAMEEDAEAAEEDIDQAAAPPPPVQGNIFSLSPAGAIQGPIRYDTSDGRKLYKDATSKLSDDLFDCVPEDLFQFLKVLEDRAREFNWTNGILSIPVDVNTPDTRHDDMLTLYGQIDLQRIKAFEEQHIKEPLRRAQDTNMLYKCLMKSLSSEGKSKILIWEKDYRIGEYVSGTMLLKVIIRESHIDTNGTTAQIRTKLSQLDDYLPTLGYDINKLNQYVQLNLELLRSRGCKTEDLLTNLFKGYLSATDRTFKLYIERKQEEYEEGTDVKPEALMKLAANKYNILKEKELWNAPSTEEEKIVALESKLAKIQAANRRQGNRKGNGKSGGKGGKKGQPQPRQQNGKGERSTKASSKDHPKTWDPPSKQELKKSKMYQGNPWYYCDKSTGGKCNGCWRRHKPSECEGRAFKRKEGKDNDASAEHRDKKRKLKLREALTAVVDNSSDGEDDEDTE